MDRRFVLSDLQAEPGVEQWEEMLQLPPSPARHLWYTAPDRVHTFQLMFVAGPAMPNLNKQPTVRWG